MGSGNRHRVDTFFEGFPGLGCLGRPKVAKPIIWLGIILATGLFGILDTHAEGQGVQFKLPGELSKFQIGSRQDPGLTTSAQIRWSSDQKTGLLQVTASMDPPWHISSMTQPPGGPTKSAIRLDPSRSYRVVGTFAPDRLPAVRFSSVFNIDVEEYEGSITWSVPIVVADGSQPSDVVIQGELQGQVCSEHGGCIPLDRRPEAKFTAAVGMPLSGDESQGLAGWVMPGLHAKVRAWLESSEVTAGDVALLQMAIEPEPGWHTYAYAQKLAFQFDHPTLIHVDLPSGWELGKVETISPIVTEKNPFPDAPPIKYHESPVTWTVPIQIPADAAATDPTNGVVTLQGAIGLQTCSKKCDAPTGFRWTGQVRVVAPQNGSQNAAQPMLAKIDFDPQALQYDEILKRVQPDGHNTPSEPSPRQVADQPSVPSDPSSLGGFDPAKVKRSQQSRSLPAILLLAFLGGFVLNFMPCVLPVIGLKVLTFVEQSGADRKKSFLLNVWYAVGILAVFWVLATLAAVPAAFGQSQFGWGAQNQLDGFNIPLIAVVFSMALSFLGIWEIPIPGFATGKAATELSDRSGAQGAFFKGIVTTLLATPCGAPGIATAYTWVVISKSIPLSYLVFTLMAIGMSFPYLCIGAFPQLVRFLPRPGAWMETFKHLMGFMLLGTVVYLLTLLDWIHVIPTVAFLFGLWFACWWIGSVPLTASNERRWRAWGISAVIAVVAFVIAFANRHDFAGRTLYGLRGSLDHRFARDIDRQIQKRQETLEQSLAMVTDNVTRSANELPWEPYSLKKLQQLTRDGNTVVVDFTADWCLTCKVLEQTVLNTREIRDFVDEHQIRTLVADWTDKDPAIATLMEQLQGAAQVPLLAIFPADRPNEPILFSGGYTSAQLIQALEQAAPQTTGAKMARATLE